MTIYVDHVHAIQSVCMLRWKTQSQSLELANLSIAYSFSQVGVYNGIDIGLKRKSGATLPKQIYGIKTLYLMGQVLSGLMYAKR